MAYTKHGHHISKTPRAKYEPLLDRKNCGGEISCKQCNDDVRRYRELAKER